MKFSKFFDATLILTLHCKGNSVINQTKLCI